MKHSSEKLFRSIFNISSSETSSINALEDFVLEKMCSLDKIGAFNLKSSDNDSSPFKLASKVDAGDTINHHALLLSKVNIS